MTKQIRFLLTLFAISFLVTTGLFWNFEASAQPGLRYGDVAWWWIVTSTTVGFGDVVPITLGGRLAGFVAILVGIFGYTHTISLILQKVQVKLEKEERGKGRVSYRGHLLICEYTAFADELIQELDASNLFPDHHKVILTTLVDRKPYEHYDFIYGVPISPKSLNRAGAPDAEIIFVFSNTRFTDPDIKTLHITSRILLLNPHADIYIELNDEHHPLLKELPREVTVMKTEDLLYSALNQDHLQLQRYIGENS